MDYASFVDAMNRLLVIPPTGDANWDALLPRAIDAAEQRIYREFDFLATGHENAGFNLTLGNRDFTVPSGFNTITAANVITPAGQTPANGKRNPVERVSIDFLSAVWPTEATTGLPKRFALLTDTKLRVAPTPDDAYTLELIGTTRPAPLSDTNTETILTTLWPDLFLAAALAFGYRYQKNFPAAQEWEGNYAALSGSAAVEDVKRKRLAGG